MKDLSEHKKIKRRNMMIRFVTSLLLAVVNVMAVLLINELKGWEKGLILGMYASVVAYAVCEAAASHGMFG